MVTKSLKHTSQLLKNGHLSLDQYTRKNFDLKEGDEIQVTLTKLKEKDSGAKVHVSLEAKHYLDYLNSSGLPGKVLKQVLQEIKRTDLKYDSKPGNELIREAYAIAEKRARAWLDKQGLTLEQLSEDELLHIINKIRDDNQSVS